MKTSKRGTEKANTGKDNKNLQERNRKGKITTGETSHAITPVHFFDYFNAMSLTFITRKE